MSLRTQSVLSGLQNKSYSPRKFDESLHPSTANFMMESHTTPGAFELVDQFHRELAAKHSSQAKVDVIRRYLALIELRGDELAADAQAIGIVAASHPRSEAPLKALKHIANSVQSSNEERRKERAIKTLVACWSWERVHHYQWERYPFKTLEAFASAAKRFPDWDIFVNVANHQLLDRHERSVKEQKIPRIGQHHAAALIQSPASPIERSDLIAITKACSGDGDLQERIRKWTEPCACLSKLFASDERTSFFALQLDVHRMLIPSQNISATPRTCSTCRAQRPQVSGLRLPVNSFPRHPTVSPSESTEDSSSRTTPIEDYIGYSSLTPTEDGRDYSISPPTDGERECDSATPTQEGLGYSMTAPTKAVSCLKPDSSPVTSSKGLVSGLYLSILAVPASDGISDCYIEQTIHRKHKDLLRSYFTRIQNEAGKGPLYRLRSQWLTASTEHAKVWLPAECGLGRGSAASQEDADVWHYTMDVFVAHAEQGVSFIRPVIIRGDQSCSDGDYHSKEKFMAFLESAYQHKHLDVHGLDQAAAESIPFVNFKAGFCKGAGFNALNLRNLTRSHRPRFAMLPRFRLLDILVERAENDSKKKTVSSPVDVASCSGGFNICAAANAFSGAHQDSLGHTYVRNLDGLKFLMTVHPRSMEGSWQEFYDKGSVWNPRGKAKLTIIEKGDIFVMMPDEFDHATVHGVHSPEASLMEGAMFFDKSRILTTLACLYEIGRHQNSTNEAIAYQLPRIIRELEGLVRIDMDLPSDRAFQTAFNKAMRRLEGLACTCVEAAEEHTCDCRTQRRRCTAWCSGHPELPSLACMEEDPVSNLVTVSCCITESQNPTRKRARGRE